MKPMHVKLKQETLFGGECTCPSIRVLHVDCPVHRKRSPAEDVAAYETVHRETGDAGIRAGMQALDKTASKHDADIVRLVPLAEVIALKAGRSGVTTSDLRIFAVQRGLLTGEEKGKSLSWLGAVMKRARLVNTGATRRSPIGRTHGIRQVVWVHSSFTEEGAG